jgi:hypothetical protein
MAMEDYKKIERENNENENSNSTVRQSKSSSYRRQFFVFLFCLAISGAMWVFIELAKDYTDELKFQVHLTNAPEDLILVNSEDTTVTVGVMAQGFDLFAYKFIRRHKSLELNLESLRIRQNGNSFSAYLPSSEIIKQIEQQLKFSKGVSTITPDTLFFKFAAITRKRVPVKLDLSFSCKQQYFLYDSVRFFPTTIVASSIKEVIDTLHFVATAHVNKENIDSTVTFKVSLTSRLHHNLFKFSQDSIKVTIPVQRYTEITFTVPVTIEGMPESIKIYPAQVELTCLVPMIDFQSVEASEFEARVKVDPTKLVSSKTLKVEVIKSPPKVKITHIKPEIVEYLILAK